MNRTSLDISSNYSVVSWGRERVSRLPVITGTYNSKAVQNLFSEFRKGWWLWLAYEECQLLEIGLCCLLLCVSINLWMPVALVAVQCISWKRWRKCGDKHIRCIHENWVIYQEKNKHVDEIDWVTKWITVWYQIKAHTTIIKCIVDKVRYVYKIFLRGLA